MSSPLAIAGVSAVLQYFLGIVYNNLGSVLSSVKVSACAPDVIQSALGSGSNPQLQVNLFLHQVTPNAAWRNMDLPRLGADGTTALQSQPLALDLHYLLTVYATDDTVAEALLGLGVFQLHQNPVFARNEVRTALTALTASTYNNALKTSGLADQIELIKVTPATLNREELAWLWTALKADYRPTFPFQATVVLIEQPTPTTLALPVLTRRVTAQPGPPPLLFETELPLGQTAPAQGDSVTIIGQGLASINRVSLSNARLGINYAPMTPTSVSSGSLTFTVPTDPSGLPAGMYDLSAQYFDTTANAVILGTNRIPFPIAPTVVGTPTVTNSAAGTLVSLTCAPDVWLGQTVSLALGSRSAPANPFTTLTTNSLSFQFGLPVLLTGKYLIRLRVDSVESPVGVNWTATPPAFTGPFLNI